MKNLFTLTFLLFLSVFAFAQDWNQIASLPANFRTDHSFAFALDGKGYIVAGATSNGFSKSFYTYDPATDEWTQKEDFPGSARGFAIGEVWNGKAYFGFGASGNNLLNDFWEYDPQTDEWTRLANCACDGRTHPAMVAINGEIYLGLGGTANGNDNDWWVYNIENDVWEERATYPAAPRHHPFQFTDGRYVYVAFGHGNGFISNQMYRYDPTDNTWLEVQRLPAEGRVAGTQMSYDGIGLILSGDGDDHRQMPTGEFWMYQPELDEWTALPPHPGISRWAPASFILNDEMYLINGERNGSYLSDNFKFDISGLTDPILSLSSNGDQLEFVNNDISCNAIASQSFSIRTAKPFDEDVNVGIVVDPSSTAEEGLDFEIETKEFTLTAGDVTLEFDVNIFDDAVVEGDKNLILALDSDAKFSDKTVEIVIEENDVEFGSQSILLPTTVGEGDATLNAPFSGFYADARNQMLYRSEMLKAAGLEAGFISSISYDVLSNNAAGYNNFTVSLAHTDVSFFNGSPRNDFDLVEVYRANVNPEPGTNQIVFDPPFEYDGESNLVLQICFDNQGYSVDDFVTATEVGYNATVGTLSDIATGCPTSPQQTISTSTLPNITFGIEGFYTPFAEPGVVFQSEILNDEDIYFISNDSIFAKISNVSSSEANCFSAQLISVTNDIQASGSFDWIDRVYSIESGNTASDEYLTTLVFPNVDQFDWNSSQLMGLFSETEPTGGATTWTPIEMTSVEVNEEYVLVTFPYQGTGYYAAGGEGISTSTTESVIDLKYDNVTIYNVSGIAVATGKTDIDLDPKWNGMYFKVYTQKGEIVKSEKIFR